MREHDDGDEGRIDLATLDLTDECPVHLCFFAEALLCPMAQRAIRPHASTEFPDELGIRWLVGTRWHPHDDGLAHRPSRQAGTRTNSVRFVVSVDM